MRERRRRENTRSGRSLRVLSHSWSVKAKQWTDTSTQAAHRQRWKSESSSGLPFPDGPTLREDAELKCISWSLLSVLCIKSYCLLAVSKMSSSCICARGVPQRFFLRKFQSTSASSLKLRDAQLYRGDQSRPSFLGG